MKKIRIIAAVCALLTGGCMFAMMWMYEEQEVVTASVVVAVSDIPQNTVITEEMLAVQTIPEELVLTGACRNKELLIGKMALVELKAGEQIFDSRLIAVGERNAASLSMMIEEDKRAITIAVDSVAGLSNMIRPGDMVDVLCHITDADENAVTNTLVENIPVLAVDNVVSTQGKSDGYSTITLMVTPEEANKIDWCGNQGFLRLILRTPLDEEQADAPEISVYNVTND
ncbi:MAG: Flp pilus assembly protein CpaB [Lachnospiraceae bacterium]